MSTVSDDLVVDIPPSRIAVASMVGTTVEFYDFYVYATAAESAALAEPVLRHGVASEGTRSKTSD